MQDTHNTAQNPAISTLSMKLFIRNGVNEQLDLHMNLCQLIKM